MMLLRKLASAYMVSALVIIFFLLSSIHVTSPGSTLFDFYAAVLIFSLYVVPIVFIYGAGVSALVEVVLGKLRMNVTMKLLLQVVLHAVFGSVLGIIVDSKLFCLYGTIAAVLFLLFDNLLCKLEGRIQAKGWLIWIASPLVILVCLQIYNQSITPPLPPFTEKDAVEFATSGKGTVIDYFPKQVGTRVMTIDGYRVERETRVAKTNKEEYEVTFIEKWEKDGVTGQHSYNYSVSRGSMTANGGGGDRIPYSR
ncbi:hypothetical protein [Paenibacillus sp. UNC451MF]|uniref:hypothetical protein n=1 Tax=Paenibacillus sp. UNC451MF TaxID=1449063 RepID=UPI000B2CF111|nr:hypothetical protein [Paenibacillus sp. UNC451MF]